MTFSHKYLTTALVSTCFFLCAEAHAMWEEGEKESIAKKAKTSPKLDAAGNPLVVVKTEPREEVRLPALLPRNIIEHNISRINPHKGDENCLPCCLSFLSWVHHGVLTEAPLKAPRAPNIRINQRDAQLIDQQAAELVPSNSFVIVIGDKEYDYIDLDAPKKIHFDPCSFSEISNKLKQIPLQEGQGGQFATGLLFLELLDKDVNKLKSDEGFQGHFLTFYITEVNGKKTSLIIDPQTREILTPQAYMRKVKAFYKDTVYLWCDRSAQPVINTSENVNAKREKMSSSDSPESAHATCEESSEPRSKRGHRDEAPQPLNAPVDQQVAGVDDSDGIMDYYKRHLLMIGNQATEWDFFAAAKSIFEAARSIENLSKKARFLLQASIYADTFVERRGNNVTPEENAFLSELWRKAGRPAPEPAEKAIVFSRVAQIAEAQAAPSGGALERYRKYLQAAMSKIGPNNEGLILIPAVVAAQDLIDNFKDEATPDDYFLAAELAYRSVLNTSNSREKNILPKAITILNSLFNLRGYVPATRDYKLVLDCYLRYLKHSSKTKLMQNCLEAENKAELYLKHRGALVDANDYSLVVRCFLEIAAHAPNSKTDFLRKALRYSENFLNLKGDQLSPEEHQLIGRCFSKNFKLSTNPEEQIRYLYAVAGHYKSFLDLIRKEIYYYGKFKYTLKLSKIFTKILELKNNSGTADDFANAAEAHREVGEVVIPTDKFHVFSQAATYSTKVLELKGNQATAEDFRQAADNFYSAGVNSTEFADKLGFFKQAATYYSKVIDLKGNQATPEDFRNAAHSFYNVGKNSPADKPLLYKQAVTFYSKVIELKGNQVTVEDFRSIASSLHYAGEHSTDSDEKFYFYAQAATYCARVIELKGDQATAEDFGKAAEKFILAGEHKTTFHDKVSFFMKAATYYNKVIELKGNQTNADDFFNAAMAHARAGDTSLADKKRFYYQSALYYSRVVALKGDKATADDLYKAATSYRNVSLFERNREVELQFCEQALLFSKRGLGVSKSDLFKQLFSEYIESMDQRIQVLKAPQAADKIQ